MRETWLSCLPWFLYTKRLTLHLPSKLLLGQPSVMAEPLIIALCLGPDPSHGILTVIWSCYCFLISSHTETLTLTPPLAWEQHFPSSLFSPHLSAPSPHQGTPGCSSHGLQLTRATYSLGPVTLDPALSPLHQARACWLAFPLPFLSDWQWLPRVLC